MAPDCHLVTIIAFTTYAFLVASFTDCAAGEPIVTTEETLTNASQTTSPTTTTSTATSRHLPRTTTTEATMAGFKLTTKMIMGLSMGFGFFLALMIVCCCSWYCCCKMLQERRDKQSPGDFRHGNKKNSTSNQALTQSSSIEA